MGDILDSNGKEAGNTEQVAQENDKTKTVTHGFDEEGFFNFKIHISAGPQTIIGWLESCKDIVKTHYVMLSQQKDKQLIRPERPPKGFFNRWR